METGMWVSVAAIGYVAGGVSFSRIVTRLLAPDVDLEKVTMPSGEGGKEERFRAVGATAASLKLGPRVGCTIGVLDILKGVAPVLAFRLLYPGELYYLVAAVFVVVGHVWPVFHRFRGGGGISSTYGGFLVVDLLGTVVSVFAGLILGTLVVRNVVLVYVSGLWFMLAWLIVVKGDWPHIVYGVVMNVLFVAAILPEIIFYLKRRRQADFDMGAAMELFPMGRGMLRMMAFFRRDPRKGTEPD